MNHREMDRYDDLSPEAIAAHDRQREMPDDAKHELITGLRQLIGAEGWSLDAGVGTGAVALPLVETGVPVVGLDLSRPMLLPLVLGDITCLPFNDDAFGSVHCAHTLHLVVEWRQALSELLRVTRPGGALLFGLGGGLAPSPMLQEMQQEFWRKLGERTVLAAQVAGPASEQEFASGMSLLGAIPLPGFELHYEQVTTLANDLDRLEHNVFGRSVDIDQDVVHDTAKRTRKWAIDQFGSLDQPLRRERTLRYHVYRKAPR